MIAQQIERIFRQQLTEAKTTALEALASREYKKAEVAYRAIFRAFRGLAIQKKTTVQEVLEYLSTIPALYHTLAVATLYELGTTEAPHWLVVRYEMGKTGMKRSSLV